MVCLYGRAQVWKTLTQHNGHLHRMDGFVPHDPVKACPPPKAKTGDCLPKEPEKTVNSRQAGLPKALDDVPEQPPVSYCQLVG